MCYKKVFLNWYEDSFKDTPLYKRMVETVEDSPWHREANVGVHTDMVVREYVRMTPSLWTKKDFIGAIQCAIHDIGKPASEETLTRDDGTTYRRYKGHELMSQRLFIDYMLSSQGKEFREYLSVEDIYNIGVISQYHLPYQLGKDKMGSVRFHMQHFGLEEVFIRCLKADTYGRISDDAEEKHKNLHDWIDNTFLKAKVKMPNSDSDTVVTIMVGPTGVGKSSYIADNFPDAPIHSMDKLRLELYDEDYTTAFKKSCDDPDFNKKVMQDFAIKIKHCSFVVVDNTNIKNKARRRYIAGKHTSDAVVFLTTLEENLKRLTNRTDKHIPVSVLHRMYWGLQLPLLGDFRDIKMVTKYEI